MTQIQGLQVPKSGECCRGNLGNFVVAQVETHQGGVSRASKHWFIYCFQFVWWQIQVGCIQRDWDRNNVWAYSTAVHLGQAKAVKEAKGFHFTVAAREAGFGGSKTRKEKQQIEPGQEMHCSPGKQDNRKTDLIAVEIILRDV